MNEPTLAQTVYALLILATFQGFLAWRVGIGQLRNAAAVRCAVVDEDARVDEP